jgi:hypothetical protein
MKLLLLLLFVQMNYLYFSLPPNAVLSPSFISLISNPSLREELDRKNKANQIMTNKNISSIVRSFAVGTEAGNIDDNTNKIKDSSQLLKTNEFISDEFSTSLSIPLHPPQFSTTAVHVYFYLFIIYLFICVCYYFSKYLLLFILASSF